VKVTDPPVCACATDPPTATLRTSAARSDVVTLGIAILQRDAEHRGTRIKVDRAQLQHSIDRRNHRPTITEATALRVPAGAQAPES